MNFCFHCGHQLTALRTASGWLARYRCDGCGQRYQLVYGDKHSSDLFIFCGNRPFDIETAIGGLVPAASDDLDLGF